MLDGRGFEDFGQPNRVSLGVAGVAEEQRVEIGLEARSEALVETPLLQHDTALQLHLFRLKADGEGPVAEDLERGLKDLGIVGRKLKPVHGVVVTGSGIQVGPEAAADRLDVVDDFLLGKALGAVEGHVLDKVGQPALRLFLEDGTRPHHERQLRPVARFFVVLDVVGQAIAERATDHRGIEGQRSVGYPGLGRWCGFLSVLLLFGRVLRLWFLNGCLFLRLGCSALCLIRLGGDRLFLGLGGRL